MAMSTARPRRSDPTGESALTEPRAVRRVLIGVSLVFLLVVLVLPLALIFDMALRDGVGAYLEAVTDPAALAAIRLTLLVTVLAVPASVVFGVAAAWAITRYRFRGKSMLITTLDLPFSVSPVIAGMVFVLLFGAHGWFGPWLTAHGVQIIFAWPGIVLATLFVVSPFVARELIPLMQNQGTSEEEVALTLGAGGWTMFWRISLPKIRWGVAYGAILCGARAVGEFGAVSVVSGHIRGRTTTVPLHVEMAYNEYQFTVAFAVASLLTLLAIVTLGLELLVERRQQQARGGVSPEVS